MSQPILTPVFRVSFPNIFKPTSFQGAEPKYSIVMLFDKKADLSELKRVIKETANDEWPKGLPKGMRNPLRDGGEKGLDGYENCFFASASSKLKPGLVDQKLQEIIKPEDFYAGCYARAQINAFAYDVSGNKGVSFGLIHVQKVKDGEPFSGRKKPQDVFAQIEEEYQDLGLDSGDDWLK